MYTYDGCSSDSVPDRVVDPWWSLPATGNIFSSSRCSRSCAILVDELSYKAPDSDIRNMQPEPCQNYPLDCAAQLSNLDVSDIVGENAGTLTAAYRVICQPRCGNPIITFYSRCGYSQYIGITRGVCTRNDAGMFCYEEFNTLLSNEQRVVTQCGIPRSSFQVCTTGCRNALITWRCVNGCCINVLNSTVFSASGRTYATLSNNLWSSCRVGTPGFCNLQMSSLNFAQAPNFLKVLLVLTFIVTAMLLL